MATQDMKRKLAAILSADVKGYSRLMGEDEEYTVRTITAYREIISSVVQKHRGRVVDTPGDNILAEFASVVDAVRSAVEIQEELKVKNAELPENRRMEFRIGINLGDVIQEKERIYGDGVNIAARVEGLAAAGGINVSGTVYDTIKNKLTLGYEYAGEHSVKNIAEPVRVYRVLMTPETIGRVIGEPRVEPRRRQKAALAVAIALILSVAGVVFWKSYLRAPSSPVEVASVEKVVYPLPDKPSIAVLPFVNISGDPEQEFFTDGITEEIITALSKVPKLFVIARDSTFSYKGRSVKFQQVGKELGVRYVLEGSVRKAAEKVRITAQLVEAQTGHHLWAERYDRNLKDVFVLQDEITMKIITALQVKLTEGEQAGLLAKGTVNLEAYLKLLQGREYQFHMNKEDNALGRQLIKEAIALDPEYANAYAFLASSHVLDLWLGASKSPRESLAQAIKLAQKSIALDDSYATAHALLGYLYTMTGKHDKGIAECELAVALDPNSATAHAWLGTNIYWADRPEEAIPLLKRAIRLNPIPPPWYLGSLAMAYRDTGRYEESISACRKALNREPKNVIVHLVLAATYVLSGLEEEARAEAAVILRIDPKFSLEPLAKTRPHKNRANTTRFIEALRKAGLK
jgi:adenylate cyclase